MTQDEIIELAEKCGWNQGKSWDDCMACSPFNIEFFANLVAAHEREAIYHIVSHAPFTEAFDDGELQSEVGDALKSMAFSICAAIRQRKQA